MSGTQTWQSVSLAEFYSAVTGAAEKISAGRTGHSPVFRHTAEKNQREGAGVTAFGQPMIESLPIII